MFDKKAYQREYAKKWYQKNKEKRLAQTLAYQRAHPEQYNALARKRYSEDIEKNRERTRIGNKLRRQHYMALCLNHYGHKCSIPGCNSEDLSIDHIDESGVYHRETGKITSAFDFHRYLVDSNFPEGFQTLCRRHNHQKHLDFIRSLRDEKRETKKIVPLIWLTHTEWSL